MTTTTAQQTRTDVAAEQPQSRGEVAIFQKPRLPYHPAIDERFGVKAAEWKALVEAVFPLAQSVDSVVLALSYCKARKLDPFKRVVHIVPIWDKNYIGPNGKKGRYTDTIWPGIGELRTTAFRTKQYAGADACAFGPMTDRVFTLENDSGERRNVPVKFPEWAQLTVYRMIDGQRVPIPGPRVYWIETYSRMGRSELPNDMWQKRPVGQLEKCAEAAALRRAFPEELGDEHTADESGGLVGPENAKDVTPRPTRQIVHETQAETEPFTFIDTDGVELRADTASSAAKGMAEAIEDAAKISKAAAEGLWESNNFLLSQLRERGHGDMADTLSRIYTETIAALTKPAKPDAAKPVEAKPDAAAHRRADEPLSPLQAKKGQKSEWPAWVDWAVAEIGRMPQGDIAGFMEVKRAEMDFVSEQRAADWTRIELAIDGRRADG